MKRRRSDSGSAGIEFALLAPLLIVLFLGALDVRTLVQAGTRTTSAAFALADLAAQAEAHDTDSLDAILGAARLIMAPLPTGTELSVSLASVGYDEDTGAPSVFWERRTGTDVPPIDLDSLRGLGAPGESVVVASLRYAYSPALALVSGRIAFEERSVARPRLVQQIAYNGQARWP